MKSLKPHQSLIGETKNKLRSLSKQTKFIITQKTAISTEGRKKRDNTERNNAANISTNADSTSVATATLDPSIFHNMDPADITKFESSLLYFSPPPPPSFIPSSTLLNPTFSVITTESAAGDRLNLGLGFHPGAHSFR